MGKNSTTQHYVAVDGKGWAVAQTIHEAVSKKILDSKKVYGISVFYVPLPQSTPYEFIQFIPYVEGIVKVLGINVINYY